MVYVDLFGSVCWQCDDGSQFLLKPQQATWLLAYLLTCDQYTASREQVASLFWVDATAPQMRQNLRQCLSQLRSLLKTLPNTEGILQTEGEFISLRFSAISTDVGRFETSLQEAQATEDSEKTTRLLQAAIDCYKAPLLADCYMEWANAKRLHLEKLYSEALQRLIHTQTEMGELESALATSKTLLAVEPYSEEAYLTTLRLLSALGQPTELRQLTAELEQMLQSEYAVDISETLRSYLNALLQEASDRATTRLLSRIPTPPEAEPISAPTTPKTPVPSPRPARQFAYTPYSLLVLSAFLVGGLLYYWRSQPTLRLMPGERVVGSAKWIAHAPTQEGDKDSNPTAMAKDRQGNIFVVGFVDNAKTDVDWVTLKYSPQGKLLWERRYDHPKGHDVDRAYALTVDDAGNAYVTGETFTGSGNGKGHLSETDMLTIKYDPDGNEVWQKPYNGSGNGRDCGWQNLLDAEGNLLVFGLSEVGEGKGYVYTLLTYSPQGEQKSVQTFPASHEWEPPAMPMALSKEGRLYLVTRAELNGKPHHLVLRCLQKGDTLWQKELDQHPSISEVAHQILAMSSGDVVLCSAVLQLSAHNYHLRHFDRDGKEIGVWSLPQLYEGANMAHILEDRHGKLYFAATVGKDIHVSQFIAPLQQKWSTGYHGTGGYGVFGSMALAPNDSLYIGGGSGQRDPKKQGASDEVGLEEVVLLYNVQGQLNHESRYVASELRREVNHATLASSDGTPVLCSASFDGKRNNIHLVCFSP